MYILQKKANHEKMSEKQIKAIWQQAFKQGQQQGEREKAATKQED